MANSLITVDYTTFLSWFPALGTPTEEQVNASYAGASSIISTHYGEIVLPPENQERGVYLATAHQLYLTQNPAIASQGKVASATEGSVSASFAQPSYKNWLDYWLSLSPYGLELLALLAQVQPPMPRKPFNQWPYYNAKWFI